MATYDLGKVVGDAGEKGDDGSTVWNTSTAPTYANSKYTFTISNLSGKTGLDVAVNDIIFYSTYYYIVSAVNSTTVDCDTRVSIKGSDASVNIVTSWNSTTSDSKVPSEKLSKTSLDGKLDKAQTSYKGKNVVVDSSTGNITFENKPTIPSKISDLTNDSDFIETSSTSGLVKNDGSIDTSSYITSSALSGYQTTSNLVTSFSGTTSDSKYPSEKLTKTELDKKIAKSSTTGLVKNDGSIDTNTYITSASLPTKTSDLTNDGSSSSDSLVYVETSSTSGLLKNDGTVDTNSYSTTSHSHNQITSDGKITSTAVTVASNDNIVITDYSDSSKIKRVANLLAGHITDSTAHSNIGSSANDTQATINSDIDTALSGKQATLVSGTNIKTINSESILGSGNITIQGGGGGSCVTDFYIDSNTDEWVIETSACSQGEVVTSWSSTLTDTKVPSEKLVKEYVDDLVGDAILFINGSGT